MHTPRVTPPSSYVFISLNNRCFAYRFSTSHSILQPRKIPTTYNMAIAGGVAVCLEAFQQLSTAESQGKQIDNHAALLPRISDEFGRFKVWSSNIGAHRSGRSSLDYRLRDASHIQKRVLELLEDLNRSLEEGEFINYRRSIAIPLSA
jgi:hypothetical protein